MNRLRFSLIMSTILITPLLSERVRLPGIIGIIIGGMLIGPHGFHLIEASDRMEFLSTIEVEVFWLSEEFGLCLLD